MMKLTPVRNRQGHRRFGSFWCCTASHSIQLIRHTNSKRLDHFITKLLWQGMAKLFKVWVSYKLFGKLRLDIIVNICVFVEELNIYTVAFMSARYGAIVSRNIGVKLSEETGCFWVGLTCRLIGFAFRNFSICWNERFQAIDWTIYSWHQMIPNLSPATVNKLHLLGLNFSNFFWMKYS